MNNNGIPSPQENRTLPERGPNPSLRLRGQVAIVTGGASGIGHATCAALAREGASVVLVDVNKSRLDEAAATIEAELNELKSSAESLAKTPALLPLALNVSSEGDMAAMAARTLEHFGRIDILVGCAGILRPQGTTPKLVANLPLVEWQQILDVNLTGIFLSNQSVLPAMIRQRSGIIVNIASTSGRHGHAFDSAYSASKFGVIGFSEALAEEVRRHNIRVQALLPDAVDTPLWDQNGPLPQPANILPAARVADLIVYMLMLPNDTILLNPIIAPFKSRVNASSHNS